MFRDAREQRGDIYAELYTPRTRVYDFPSRGKVVRAKGRLSGEVHHFLSHYDLNSLKPLGDALIVGSIGHDIFSKLEF